MGLYDSISGTAVVIYMFLFLIIINAKRSNIRDIFLGLLAISIMWTGGSLFMRTRQYPGYEFWYHISLLGIFFMPVIYFRFIMEYAQKVNLKITYGYAIVMGVSFLINLFTGLFIPPPVIQTISGVETMVYEEMGIALYFLFVVGIGMVVQMLYWFYKGIKQNPIIKRVGYPISIGILAVFFGNILLLTPIFSSFPIDILAGLLNAFALLFAITMRSPFKLQMATSERVGYLTCLLLGLLTTYILHSTINDTLKDLSVSPPYWISWYLIIFSTFLVVYFVAYRYIIVGIFIKEAEVKTGILNEFSATVHGSLESERILQESIQIIKQVIGDVEVYFFTNSERGFTYTEGTRRFKEELESLRYTNPIFNQLSNTEYITFADFILGNEYTSMKASEKKLFEKLKVSYIYGLYDGDELFGMLMVSEHSHRKQLRMNQVLRLQSISTIVSISLANARSYEKAVIESQTDNLTGLYNRKYFYHQIQIEFEKCIKSSLALVMINLDDFKLYNQLYGVKDADAALDVIAALIQNAVNEDATVARYSGKEFAIILPNYDVKQTLRLVRKIKHSIQRQVQQKNGGLKKIITASIGICAYPVGANTVNELIENVQQAVYYVKRNGKNKVKVFDTFVKKNAAIKKNKTTVYNEHSSTIYALTAAIDAKDHYTFSHSENVANYAVAFAERLHLNDEIVENIRQAALLHDIGKIAIDESILNKPDKLTKEEYKIIQGHVDASIDIIRHLPSLDYVIPAVLGHHERYDGTGYPRRTSGEDIPLTARILCIADSVDAMLSVRAYKPSKTLEEVIHIIEYEAGKQFDPTLAKKFVEMLQEGTVLNANNQLEIKQERILKVA